MKKEIKQADTKKSTSLLKKYLREKYGIVCSVRSEFYSMGCSLNVSYKLGPDEKIVDTELDKLQYGAFDSMTDCSYSVKTAGIVVDGYQLKEFKHVFVKQEWSNEFAVKLCQFMFSKIKFGDLVAPVDYSDYCAYKPEVFEYEQGCSSLSNFFYRRFLVSNFATQDENKINLLECHLSEKNNGCIYFIYEVDGVKYSTEEYNTPQTEKKARPAAVECPADEVQVIEYNKKAIAVIGNTYPIREKLKAAGGKFNKFLTCGPGWIFSKSKLEALQALLSPEEQPEPPTTEPVNNNLPAIIEPQTTLRDEVIKTVEFFAETDIKLNGHITDETKHIAEVQNVEIAEDWRPHPDYPHDHPLNLCNPAGNQYKEAVKYYSNIKDITEAANNGEIISLYNLANLANGKEVANV